MTWGQKEKKVMKGETLHCSGGSGSDLAYPSLRKFDKTVPNTLTSGYSSPKHFEASVDKEWRDHIIKAQKL